MTDTHRILLLPGWMNSDPPHWQSRWEALHGFERVEQDDWVWPRRGDWMARLDQVVLDEPAPATSLDMSPITSTTTPVVLVAHSLGCHLVAAWASHSRHTGRIAAALLVAPPDAERDDMPPNIFNWRPIARGRLPFPSLLVASSDDPYCDVARARRMAADWGSDWVDAGPRGHLNGGSGLGDWPEGHELLRGLVERAG